MSTTAIGIDEADEAAMRNLKMEIALSKAFLGRGIMDITSPPSGFKLVFGRYNARRVNKPAASKLVKSFNEEGTLRWQNEIPVGVSRSWVDRSLLKRSSNDPYSALNEIVFVDQGLPPKAIEMYGGAHRAEALRLTRDAKQKQKTTAEKQVDKIQKKKVPKAMDEAEKRDAEQARQQDVVKRLDRELKSHGYWAVKLYDLGESPIMCPGALYD